MSEVNLVMSDIEEAFKKMHKSPAVYKKKILSYLIDLRTKEEYHLSDTEFYAIVRETFKLHPKDFLRFFYDKIMKRIGKLHGNEKRIELEENILEKNFISEIFKSNPEYYMNNLYSDLRQKMGTLYGVERRREIERYILEKFCFYSGEQILYEYDGRISLRPSTLQYVFKSDFGPIIFTNYRLIALGKFKAKAYQQVGFFTGLPKTQKTRLAKYKAQKAEDAIYDISEREELPCYGYVFPTKNLSNLKKQSYSANGDISYTVELDDAIHIIQIHSPSFKIEMEENINKVFEILSQSRKE